MKRKLKRLVAAEKEKNGKKITELVEKKTSKALEFVCKLCKQSKTDKTYIVGMPCRFGKTIIVIEKIDCN